MQNCDFETLGCSSDFRLTVNILVLLSKMKLKFTMS